MSRIHAVLIASLILLAPVAARADIQSSGPEVWPGKIMIGARPLGIQLNFENAWIGPNGNGYAYGVGDWALFKFNIDVAGRIADLQNVTIWLGGEVNIGGRANLAMLEPGIFVQITLEKLLKIPLVPLIRAGFSGPLYVPYGFTDATLDGAFQLKIGAGAYYFLTRNIGLGLETNFAFGPGFINYGGALATGFSGYWDFSLGAKFAF